MRLILVRHGETEENKLKILQGRTFGKLSPEGIIQAKKVAERLKWLKVDVIYTSALNRCLITAREIAKFHSAPVIIEPLLIEKEEGELTGQAYDKIDWRKVSGDKFTGKVNGAESLVEVMERTKKFYHFLLKKHQHHNVIVVSHGSPIRTLIGVALNETIEQSFLRKNCGNTAITEITIDTNRKANLVCYDCKKHLQA